MDSTAELAPSGVTKGSADPAMGGGGGGANRQRYCHHQSIRRKILFFKVYIASVDRINI